MSQYKRILNDINNLPSDNRFKYIKENLRDCLRDSEHLEWDDMEKLSDFILSDNDVLDNQDIVDEESEIWVSIREIQNDIIDNFYDNEERV